MLFPNACAYPRRRQVVSIHRAAEKAHSRKPGFRHKLSRKSSFVLCSNVCTARSVGYTGLSSQGAGLPFLCLLGNSHNGDSPTTSSTNNDRFWYTVLEPALRGSGGPIKGSAEEAVRRARPAPRCEPTLPLRAASGVLLDRSRLSG